MQPFTRGLLRHSEFTADLHDEPLVYQFFYIPLQPHLTQSSLPREFPLTEVPLHEGPDYTAARLPVGSFEGVLLCSVNTSS